MRYVAFFFAVLILACSGNTASRSQDENQDTKAATTKETTAARPQYVITVTHGGRPLGEIVVELFPDIAPKHVRNFDSLVSIGFYNGTAFHRVIPGFMIQGGDPNSKDKPRERWGTGDPSQTLIPAEFNPTSHTRGILSAARRGNDINSATSQFFICVANASQLDNQYTVYGQTISGMDVVDKVVNAPRDERDNPLEKIEMKIVKKEVADGKGSPKAPKSGK